MDLHCLVALDPVCMGTCMGVTVRAVWTFELFGWRLSNVRGEATLMRFSWCDSVDLCSRGLPADEHVGGLRFETPRLQKQKLNRCLARNRSRLLNNDDMIERVKWLGQTSLSNICEENDVEFVFSDTEENE